MKWYKIFLLRKHIKQIKDDQEALRKAELAIELDYPKTANKLIKKVRQNIKARKQERLANA